MCKNNILPASKSLQASGNRPSGANAKHGEQSYRITLSCGREERGRGKSRKQKKKVEKLGARTWPKLLPFGLENFRSAFILSETISNSLGSHVRAYLYYHTRVANWKAHLSCTSLEQSYHVFPFRRPAQDVIGAEDCCGRDRSRDDLRYVHPVSF